MVTLLSALGWALQIYYWILIAYILMSWIPEIRGTKLHRIVHNIANPYMRIFRGLLVFGMFDFTPVIGFLLYNLGMNYYWEMVAIIASR